MRPHDARSMCAIRALNTHLPERRVTSEEVGRTIGVDREWIVQRTGISERRHAAAGTAASDLGACAAAGALGQAGMEPRDVDMLICATCTGDMVLPSTACWIHRALNWPPMPAFDVGATCSGFMYAMELAAGQIGAGRARNVMIIATEAMSHFLDPVDRQCTPLFGDGAVAAVVASSGWLELIDSRVGADGRHASIITIPAGGSRKPTTDATIQLREHFIRMNGREVFRRAVERMTADALAMLSKWGIGMEDVRWVVPHQANARMAEAVAEQIALPRDKLVLEMEDIGNTSGASIPFALARARCRMRSGELVLSMTFGAGATWGCQLYRVAGAPEGGSGAMP